MLILIFNSYLSFYIYIYRSIGPRPESLALRRRSTSIFASWSEGPRPLLMALRNLLFQNRPQSDTNRWTILGFLYKRDIIFKTTLSTSSPRMTDGTLLASSTTSIKSNMIASLLDKIERDQSYPVLNGEITLFDPARDSGHLQNMVGLSLSKNLHTLYPSEVESV